MFPERLRASRNRTEPAGRLPGGDVVEPPALAVDCTHRVKGDRDGPLQRSRPAEELVQIARRGASRGCWHGACNSLGVRPEVGKPFGPLPRVLGAGGRLRGVPGRHDARLLHDHVALGSWKQLEVGLLQAAGLIAGCDVLIRSISLADEPLPTTCVVNGSPARSSRDGSDRGTYASAERWG